MELAMTPPKKSLQRSTQSSGRPGLPPAGVVGMGLMGTSIAVCLLGAGHSVVGIARNSEKHRGILKRLMGLLNDSAARGPSHTRAVSSKEAVTTRRPSGLNAAEWTH